jgi:mono/diheme cytochrome c family protein
MQNGRTKRLLLNKMALLAAVALATGYARADTDGSEFFEKNVRPLFAQRCLVCHAASAQPMGGLRLDSREALFKGGSRGAAIVAGKPDESLLIRAIRQTDSSLRMPPSGKLTEAEIAILTQWVAMGAPWASNRPPQSENSQKFWAFTRPAEPTVPEVKNTSWVKSPIDAFVLAGLEAKDLKPAPPAGKRELLRRATFDLTGLPPTPEEVQAFLKDGEPQAFARVVDRLLASPRYGERWGRHWLDVARYADSNGLDENLVYKNAFRYRDYVIQAFNQDKPYDQFVREQLAGDLLPEAKDLATSFERWTATGFLSLGAKMLAEDDPVKMEMDIVDEQLDTAARAFMGLTVGCARCHDHKFDPIPQADYYSMAGIFKSSKTMENFKVVAKWHEYVLAPPEDRARLQAHEDKIKAKTKEIDRLTKAENRHLAEGARKKIGEYLLAADDVLRYAKIPLKPALDNVKTSGPGVVVRMAGSFDRGNAPRQLEKGKPNVASGEKGPFLVEYDIAVPAAGNYQVDLLEEETGDGTADISVNGVLMKKGAAAVQNRAASPDAGGWTVAGIFPFASGRNTVRLEHKSRFPYFEKLAVSSVPAGAPLTKTNAQVARQYGINPGYLDHWVEEMRRAKGAPHSVLFAWYAFEATGSLDDASLSGWTSPAAKLFQNFHPKTREALSARYQEFFQQADRDWQALRAGRPEADAIDADNEAEDASKKEPKESGLPDASLEGFREFLYAKAGPFRAPVEAKQYFPPAAQEQLTLLEKENKDLEAARPQYPQAMGVCEGPKIGDLPIHIRGSHWTLGQTVPRRFLRVIAGENQAAIPEGQSGRLQLAEWLTQPDHPLTSRVIANRIWRWHFGRGIVPSVDNFGRLGEPPTNLPLLNWLALRFVENGWSIKQMHRLTMLSNTYQMSTAYDARAAEIDPENTLLWRANRRRLEAEEIRDAVMAVSGNLDLTAGGTILTYKDREYVADTEKRGGSDYDRNRRAVYIPVVRSSMYEVFQAFDLPDPSTSNGDRNSTVVAPQALFMMNGSVVLAHTRTMAEKLLARADLDDSGRVRDAYERALGRPPSSKEIDRALSFIAQVDRAIEGRTTDPAKRRGLVWQSFCKSLISSNEFIYLN